MDSRRLRQGDLRVQGHLRLKVWWKTPLIWATPAGDLLYSSQKIAYVFIRRKKYEEILPTCFLMLFLLPFT